MPMLFVFVLPFGLSPRVLPSYRLHETDRRYNQINAVSQPEYSTTQLSMFGSEDVGLLYYMTVE